MDQQDQYNHLYDKHCELQQCYSTLKAENAKLKDVIRRALAIKTIWLCPSPGSGPDVEEECKALVLMAEQFTQALEG
jgi:hypothetical protein